MKVGKRLSQVEGTGGAGGHGGEEEEEDQGNKIMFEHAIMKSHVTIQNIQMFYRQAKLKHVVDRETSHHTTLCPCSGLEALSFSMPPVSLCGCKAGFLPTFPPDRLLWHVKVRCGPSHGIFFSRCLHFRL